MKTTDKKRPLNPVLRELIIFAERLLLVFLAVSITLIFTNSFFKVSTSYGTTYHYGISPLEKGKTFEEKEIFHSLLLGNMEQIVQYVSFCHILETEGAYNGKKIIDISDYGQSGEKNTSKKAVAKYYLDDLIAWGNYGFDYRTYTGSWEELEKLFSGQAATKEAADTSIKEYAGSLEENKENIMKEAEEKNRYAMEVIIPRYRTVDGKDLMEYASDIEEYEKLKTELTHTAKEVFEAYTQYIALKEHCVQGKTNVNYYFRIPVEEGFVEYSNSGLELSDKNTDGITAFVREKGGRFIFFDPDKVQINTNTEISAKQMRNLIKAQEDVFVDSTKVWFWVNEDYVVPDGFQTANTQLKEFRPYLQMLASTAIISFFGILLSMVYLTKKEGRVRDENGKLFYQTKKIDQFPAEIWMIIALAIELALCYLIVISLFAYQKGNIRYNVITILVGLLAFIGNELAIRCYFSMIRRRKAKVFWKSTLLYYGGKKGKEFLLSAYENGGIVSKTWIPYLIFLMINLILVLLGAGGVLGAFLLDILIGIFLYNQKRQLEEIVEGIEKIRQGDSKYRIDTTGLKGENYRLATAVNSIGMGIRQAVETSMKDEKMKTDLITNVSHDIKTPLTSIITYVDLLKREKITEQRILNYLDILDSKSQRLKQLIDDLVEASKISSGNISLQLEIIDFVQLVKQALGEFDEKLNDKQLQLVFKAPAEPMYVEADSSHLWRVMENLMSNACKYSLSGTRIYVEMEVKEKEGRPYSHFFIKNISENLLEVGEEELMERFMRGDTSRKTEGSGLGLSIAQNLVQALNGEFKIELDGDLFKASIIFPIQKSFD